MEDGPAELRHGAVAVENPVPIVAIVGFVVGLVVAVIGVRRWYDGDHRPLDGWLVSSALLFGYRAFGRLVIARRWTRLYRVLGIDPDDVGKTGVYRPPPDPRRTRRQRLIDRFSDDLDRSGEPTSMSFSARAGRVAEAALERILDVTVGFAPLLGLVLGLSALDLVYAGLAWSWLTRRALFARG